MSAPGTPRPGGGPAPPRARGRPARESRSPGTGPGPTQVGWRSYRQPAWWGWRRFSGRSRDRPSRAATGPESAGRTGGKGGRLGIAGPLTPGASALLGVKTVNRTPMGPASIFPMPGRTSPSRAAPQRPPGWYHLQHECGVAARTPPVCVPPPSPTGISERHAATSAHVIDLQNRGQSAGRAHFVRPGPAGLPGRRRARKSGRSSKRSG